MCLAPVRLLLISLALLSPIAGWGQTSSPLSTGRNYIGADLGLTYAEYSGASNFFWPVTDAFDNIETYLRFDNLGSGIGALAGLKGGIALSHSIDLEGKLRFLSNYTSNSSSQ